MNPHHPELFDGLFVGAKGEEQVAADASRLNPILAWDKRKCLSSSLTRQENRLNLDIEQNFF